MIIFFIVIQITLLIIMMFHDFTHIPPLTNINDLRKEHSFQDRLIQTIINSSLVFIPLVITLFYYPMFPTISVYIIMFFYSLLTIGTIVAWWIPYIFGPYSKKHKEGFREFENTHHFLPKIKDHVIPNTMHVILHIHVWISLILSIILL